MSPPPSRQADNIHPLTKLLCAAIAIAPFMAIYPAHFAMAPEGKVGSGFVQADMAYYLANGREIFERGNGVTYPNPYDPEGPAIYFHWLIWLLGVGVVFAGIDPGVLFMLTGIVASVIAAYLMFLVVMRILPEPRLRIPLFFAVMWGGGLLAIGGLARGVLFTGVIHVLYYDPFDGWWMLSWGRSLVYSTEAVYHAIVAGVFLAILTQRQGWAIAGAVALATTHPFTGVQILLILCAWLGVCFAVHRSRGNAVRMLIVVATLAAFLGYYKVFLPSFAAHEKIHRDWSLDWGLTWWTIALAYLPIGIIGLTQVTLKRRELLRPQIGFFIVFAAVSLLLVKHDLVIEPIQPLHFTRGYVWTPLCLLALPLIQRVLLIVQARVSRPTHLLVGVALSVLMAADNIAFVATQYTIPTGLYATRGIRPMFAEMERRGITGTLLCIDSDDNYLSATYTGVTPYVGQRYLTPNWDERLATVGRWRGADAPWLEAVDLLLAPKAEMHPGGRLARLDEDDWELVFENDAFQLLRKR